MRIDPAGARLDQRNREPLSVVAIMYDVGSIYLTNKKAGAISNVPGSVVAGCLEDISAVSQELHPDEGRATIGSLSFSAVDLAGALTDLIRDQLFDEDAGVRHHEVRLFTGDSSNFTDGTWRQVATYIVDGIVEYDQGAYRFSCSDRQREMRKDIFTLAKTRLEVTLEPSHIVMTVNSTDGFEMLQHTASFTDAPLATVGYLHVLKTGEIIRYTAKTATTFTGLVREINSVATRVEVAPPPADDDKKPEIEEFPYLELPAPQLAYALLTGTILGTAITLPESWHLGVATTSVDSASFTNIGTDLFDPNNFDAGTVLRFIHRKKVDGKRFIEEQVLAPIGCFLAITADGKLQLRRMVRALADAATIRTLTDDDFISHGPLGHDQSALINEVDLHWNYDGDGFTRTAHLVNGDSITTHKLAGVRELECEGLVPTRVSPDLVKAVFDRITDRYGAPPLKLAGQISAIHNDLEVGDCIRVQLTNVRDYAGITTLDRAFEIQQISVNWITGDVEVQLFGSAARVEPDAPGDNLSALADLWYSSQGTNLTSVLTIVGGAVTTNGSITGGSDLRTAVFYFGGNLTINAGVTVTITGNVQLRILGTLTINGSINGVGGGIAAVSDPNSVSSPLNQSNMGQVVQTVGSTRGSDGIWFQGGQHLAFSSIPYMGLESLPRFSLQGTEAGGLEGIPAELRGTQGAWGMGVLEGGSLTVRALGSAGGASGAGLMLVLRGGLVFGVSGTINLSGQNGAAPGSSISVGGKLNVPGGGGGGAPGCLLVAFDKRDTAYPDLVNKFIANHGSTTQSGSPVMRAPPDNPAEPWTGYFPGISTASHFDACHQIQYLPIRFSPLGEGSSEAVPVPTIVDMIGTDYGIEITIESIPEAEYDVVEVWGSIDNNRANATKLATGRGTLLRVPLTNLVTYWIWLRARHGARRSDWSSAADAGEVIAGGPALTAITEWFESFDSYATQEDFEKEWLIAFGAPTITFPADGVNGGKVLNVVGGMHAIYRRNIPFDPNWIYEIETRFRRTVAQTNFENITLGFFGVMPDGVNLIDRFGDITGSNNFPNASIINNYNQAFSTLNEWKRHLSWISDSINTNSITDGPLFPMAEGEGLYFPRQIRASRGSWAGNPNIVQAAFVRPTIQINDPFGTTSAAQIDHIRYSRMPTRNQSVALVHDSNFNLSLDGDHWISHERQASGAWAKRVQIIAGAGPDGSHAAFWDIVGGGVSPAENRILHHRQLFPVADAVKVSIRYRFANVSTIHSGATFLVDLEGYKYNPMTVIGSGSKGRTYTTVGGSSPEQSVQMNTLTTDGSWQRTTLTFTGLFADTNLSQADFMELKLFVQAGDASNNFDFYVGRCQVSFS